MAAIVEEPSFYPYLTATENLRVFALMAGWKASASRRDELLDTVGLKGQREKPVRAFSSGMKQRLGIAACLVTSPDVLFLDEPFNGLDPGGVVDMRQLLSELRRAGTTIFLSSHDLSEVEQLCTHVAFIREGRLLSQSTMSDAMTSTARVLVRAAPIDSVVEVLEHFSPGNAPKLEDGVVRIALDETQIPEMIRQLVGAGVDVYEIHVERDSLEDIFFRIVGGSGRPGNPAISGTGRNSVKATETT